MVFVESKDSVKSVYDEYITIKSFHIGKYEVTQGQWKAVMGENPSHFKNGDNYPVEMVSWNDIQEFIGKLNAATGKQYRLPAHVEWVYVARGGNKSQGYAFSGSNNRDDVGWYKDNSGGTTHPVGTKAPNELGIYDMYGNVSEWCADRMGDRYHIQMGCDFLSILSENWLFKYGGIQSDMHEKSFGFRLAHP